MAENRARVGTEWTAAITTMSMVVCFVVVVAALYWAQSIFIPVALAVLLSFVLSPAVSWMQRRGAGRMLAVVLVVLVTFATGGIIGAVVAQQLTTLGKDLPNHEKNILTKIETAKHWLVGSGESPFGKLIDDVTRIVSSKPPKESASPVTVWGVTISEGISPETSPPMPVVIQNESSWVNRIQAILSPAVQVLGTAAFANVLVIFMLLKKEDLRNRMIRLIGHGRVTTTTKAVDDASTRISRFLLTQLGLNAAFGLVMMLGLTFIKLPYPVLWGFLAFVMRYVPYIGTWIGVIPPAMFALAVSEGWGPPVEVLVLFLGTELICNNIFEPWLYGSSMGLSQVAQLIAAGFWSFLWGPIGLILSGPLTVCLLVLGKYVRRLEFLDILLGDEPALEPRVAFYQRLAARDQDEASAIALEAVKASTPEAVYDSIVLPALCLAKQDHEAGNLSDTDWDEAVRAAREVGEEVADAGKKKADGAVIVEGADDRVRLLLVPAKDPADLAAIEMLTHLLDPSRWNAEVVTDETLASELLEKVRTVRPAAVVIGSLPPGGVAHTRYLVSRLRAKFPDLKLLVGRWGQSVQLGEDDEKIGIAGADWRHDTIAQSLRHLTEWAAVFAQQDTGAALPESDGYQAPVGTTTASVA